MIQFYFMSILLNLLIGFVLVFFSNNALVESSYEKTSFFESKTFRIIVGGLALLTGILKLFFPMNGIVILGDFIPAICGIVGGFCILLDFYVSTTTLTFHQESDFVKIIFGIRKYIGVCLMFFAVLHFLFPKIIFF